MLLGTSQGKAPGVLAVLSAIIFDQFTAANNTNINGRAPSPTNTPGNAYVVVEGTAQIQGNQASAIALADAALGGTDVLVALDAGVHDFCMTAKVTPVANAVSGLIGRYQDASHFWLAALAPTSTLYLLLANGGYSVADQPAAVITAGVQYLVGITMIGNSIIISLDGVNRIARTAANFNTATKVGWRKDQIGVLLDDLKVTAAATYSTVDTTSPPTGQNIRVLVPSTYDAGVAAPLVLYHHGVGETQTALSADVLKCDVLNTLLSNGYIVAGTNAHGDNWGNANGVTDYEELYNYCVAHYNISRVICWAQSMGSQSGLLSFAQGVIPYKGYLGTYPVCSLANMFGGNAGAYASSIRNAFGIAADGSDYAAKTAGHDPALLSASVFDGKRMRFYASADDTSVSKVNNSEAMVALVTGHAVECSEVACSGNHGDPSHFRPSDYLEFLARCI